ncbi:uncharacterized protein B0T15DRAFT_50990 [Chaetomium strumarium]|uniref:FAD-binding PCMH-type domain-containing protein n=1 Tax=Chaetomium strumarium TaxID=1170767 RepID=A0AAJ0H3G0_9PEZI|nr:hypothetical protein B0T15DRAFT_50990 [Chaetomium strumarium]
MYLWHSGFVCAVQLFPSVLAASVAPRLDNNCPTTQCKAVPGTPGWPSARDWAALNESLAGRLLQPPPPGAVCHPGEESYDATECSAVRAAWSSYEFHAANPISADWNQWTNESCLPQEGAPCSGKGYPVFVINATEARHVQLGVQFAREHNVRLIVKSTGHDFIGRSSAPNSLSIWTHNMKDIRTHDSFRPSRCNITIEGPAVTVGAGAEMWDVYSALDRLNQTVVGGGGKTVSVGGYLTGAGHSLLSPRYGLAADQVLEMEVVTPTGEIVTANECQNEDLFWAMRGGGGSTFGVMTSVTMKTYPSPKIESVLVGIVTTDVANPRAIFDMTAYVLGQFPSLGDQGLSGYAYFSPGILSTLPGTSNITVAGFAMYGALQDTTPEAMRALWDPIFTRVNETWPGLFQQLYLPKSYPSFLAYFTEKHDQTPAGLNEYIGSRLLDRDALTSDLAKSSAAFERFSNGSAATAFLVSGKGVFNAKPRGRGGNAVLPAWRKAYVHATLGVIAPPLDPAGHAAARKQVQYRVQGLRELAPHMGAYMNEAASDEPNYQHEFWGSHYERLLRIKRAVDPDDVLWCNPCVGNERWKEEAGDRLCRVYGDQGH